MNKNIFPFLLIILFTIIIWHKILNQTIANEGYYYFWMEGLISSDFTINGPRQLDNFARLIFQTIEPIFKDSLIYYMAFQLLVIVLLNMTLYFVLFKITKLKLMSICAVVLFTANYMGSYDLYGTGNYQRFIQRIPNLIPLLFSFYFLFKFFQINIYRYLIYSWALFALSIFLAHFSTFLLPVFIIFILINSKLKITGLLKSGLLALIFIGTNFYLISDSAQKPTVSIFDFLRQNNVFTLAFYHLPSLIVPLGIIEYIGKYNSIGNPYTRIIYWLITPLLLIFILSFLIVKKRMPYLFKLYLTFFLSLPLINILNSYSYAVDLTKNFGPDRYLILPSLVISILLVILFNSLFMASNRFKILGIILVCGVLAAYNTFLIWKNMDQNQYKYTATKKFISYIKKVSPKFHEDSVLIAPQSMLWSNALIAKYYGYESMQYVDFASGWEEKLNNVERDRIFVIDYDFEGVGGDKGPNQGKIVDLTQKFRQGGKVTYTKY